MRARNTKNTKLIYLIHLSMNLCLVVRLLLLCNHKFLILLLRITNTFIFCYSFSTENGCNGSCLYCFDIKVLLLNIL